MSNAREIINDFCKRHPQDTYLRRASQFPSLPHIYITENPPREIQWCPDNDTLIIREGEIFPRTLISIGYTFDQEGNVTDIQREKFKAYAHDGDTTYTFTYYVDPENPLLATMTEITRSVSDGHTTSNSPFMPGEEAEISARYATQYPPCADLGKTLFHWLSEHPTPQNVDGEVLLVPQAA